MPRSLVRVAIRFSTGEVGDRAWFPHGTGAKKCPPEGGLYILFYVHARILSCPNKSFVLLAQSAAHLKFLATNPFPIDTPCSRPLPKARAKSPIFRRRPIA